MFAGRYRGPSASHPSSNAKAKSRPRTPHAGASPLPGPALATRVSTHNPLLPPRRNPRWPLSRASTHAAERSERPPGTLQQTKSEGQWPFAPLLLRANWERAAVTSDISVVDCLIVLRLNFRHFFVEQPPPHPCPPRPLLLGQPDGPVEDCRHANRHAGFGCNRTPR